MQVRTPRLLARIVVWIGLGLLLAALGVFVLSAGDPGGAAAAVARAFALDGPTAGLEPQTLDFRYAAREWQTCIGLSDDPHKTMVLSDGSVCYDYHEGGYFGDYDVRLTAGIGADGERGSSSQRLWSPRVPIVVTEQHTGGLTLHQEAWAGAPRAAGVEEWARRRVDYLWLTADGADGGTGRDAVAIDLLSRKEYVVRFSNTEIADAEDPNRIFCRMSPSCTRVEVVKARKGHHLRLVYEIGAGDDANAEVLLTLYRGRDAFAQTSVEEVLRERDRAVAHWEQLDLPYDRILLPDRAAQSLLEASIRNIYQSRELKDGRPAFQVGPTCYRSTWAADGPFLLEAVTYLGEAPDARQALELQLEGEGGPGGVKFSKKAGLRLWMIWRHAQLTGDWKWLRDMWPQVKAEAERIADYRQMTRVETGQANYGLMPAGFGDGGLAGLHREYTNVHWTLVGLRCAIDMAARLDAPEERAWRTEYEDYWRTFERARRRDKREDEAGNVYVPVTMKGEQEQLPQRGAWTFLHAVYPGRLFEADDTLMRGTMAMLDARQAEGLILGTGWLDSGLWTYAGSFYAHAHLWCGHGRKAAATFYAFANHACPLLCWREEQMPAGEAPYVGDMPHNWASAEYIRLVRHLMILERGRELHLLEGLPQAWTAPGARIGMTEIPTTFGLTSLSVTMADDGRSARIVVVPPDRERVRRIVLHLEHFGAAPTAVTCNDRDMRDDGLRIDLDGPLDFHVQFDR